MRHTSPAQNFATKPVYLHAYKTVSEARAGISWYLNLYNSRRPYSSLDQQTPDQAYFNALTPMIMAA
ncbi:integrase core domain-containing protein [Brucella sp. BE17]|uniref:integrase core domain-containing protein n=1 Tax=Brucella sp. BE17 TaxID=3142977 RepID=UPI0031BB6509